MATPRSHASRSDGPPDDGPRTKGERSRCEILDAAKALISSKGFSAITVQDVLDAAKVTKGKFFHHFDSKEQLFTELLKYVLAERDFLRLDEIVKRSPETEPFARLVTVIDQMIKWHRGGLPEVMRLCVFATLFFPPDAPEMKEISRRLGANSRVIEQLVRESIAEGALPASLDPRSVAQLIPSASIGGYTVGYLSQRADVTSAALELLRDMLVALHESCTQRTKR